MPFSTSDPETDDFLIEQSIRDYYVYSDKRLTIFLIFRRVSQSKMKTETFVNVIFLTAFSCIGYILLYRFYFIIYSTFSKKQTKQIYIRLVPVICLKLTQLFLLTG